MSILRTCAVTVLLVPTLVLCAADKKSTVVTPVSLINQTIPTYGVVNQVPHYTDSRANTLYLEIHHVLAEVESHVMSGKSTVVKPVDPKKNKKAQEIVPTEVIGDARLGGLLSRLVELDARITYRTYVEQWQIDNSFSDLARAAEMQLLSGYVSAETAASVQQARAKAAADAKAEAAAKAKSEVKVKTEAPKVEPKAKPEVEVPKVEVPAVEAPAAEPAPAVEAPAAEPAPAVVPPPEL